MFDAQGSSAKRHSRSKCTPSQDIFLSVSGWTLPVVNGTVHVTCSSVKSIFACADVSSLAI